MGGCEVAALSGSQRRLLIFLAGRRGAATVYSEELPQLEQMGYIEIVGDTFKATPAGIAKGHELVDERISRAKREPDMRQSLFPDSETTP